jgi:large subunit ribosomal protein L32
MPVPKRKTSKARRDQRQSTKFIRPEAIASCANCGVAISPHQVCTECGYYKGRKIMKTKSERKVSREKNKPKSNAQRSGVEAIESETKAETKE